MKPNRFEISAQYSKKLSKEKTLFVTCHKDKDGVQMNISTTLPSGNTTTILLDKELDDAYGFLKETLKAFNTLVTLNDSFVTVQPEQED